MSEQTDREEITQTETTIIAPATSSVSKDTEWNRNIASAIALCSLALIGCFFLPWVRIFLGDVSGYQVQQLSGDDYKLVWLIPCGGLLALLAAVAKQGMAPASRLAGGIPFVALVYFRLKIGEGFFQALEVGAYLTLILGAILVVLPNHLKKPKP